MLRSLRFLSSIILILAALIVPSPAGATAPIGALRVWSSEPATLDPALASYQSEGLVINQIYERLVSLNDQFEIVPALASSWTVSPDSTVFIFTLGQTYFANGRQVEASDVVYSLMRALSPTIRDGQPGYMAFMLFDIKGAEAYNGGATSTPVGIEEVNASTVRITLERPVPAGLFLKKLSQGVASVVAQEEVAAGGDTWWHDPARRAGTGPFRLAEWSTGQYIRLVRNLRHDWSAVHLQSVLFRFLADAPAALAEYRAGQIDVMSVGVSIAADVNADPVLKAQLQTAAGTCYSYFALHNQRDPFSGDSGMKLRQAINHAVDKADFIQRGLGGFGIAARGVIPPSIYGYNPSLQSLDYNVPLAKQRLAESGYTGDPPIVVYYANTSSFAKWRAEWLRDQLSANLGIEVSLTTDSTIGYQVSFRGWCADYPDPENFLPWLLKTGAAFNHARYSNPTFDDLVTQAAGMFDESQRITLYREAEQLAISEAAELPLHHDMFAVLIKPAVQGPMAHRWQWTGSFADISLDYRPVFLPFILR